MAPLGYTVRLINGQHGNLLPLHHRHKPFVFQPLRRHIQQLQPPGRQAFKQRPILIQCQRTIQPRRLNSARAQKINLIFHQSNQR